MELGEEEMGEEEQASPKKGKGAKKRGHAATKGGAKGKRRGHAAAIRREEQSASEGEAPAEVEPEAKKAKAEDAEGAAPQMPTATEEEQPAAEEEAPIASEKPEKATEYEAPAVEEAGEEAAPAPEAGAAPVAEEEEVKEPEFEAAGEAEQPTEGQGVEEVRPTQIGETQEEPDVPAEAPQPMQAAEEHQTEAQEEPQTTAKQATTSSGADTVEQGRIIFLYRPKVGLEEASSIAQVQRFYMIFVPEGAGKRPRLAVVGKKRLPQVGSHERFFGFIEAVADTVESLSEGLGPRRYETKTRGTREVAAARAVGEGTYAIVNRGGSGAGAGRTHLVLHLLVPAQPGEVQEDFAIPKEGSYVFSVKNPGNEPFQAQGGGAIGLEEKAEYEPEQKKEFGGYAWIGVTDPKVSSPYY